MNLLPDWKAILANAWSVRLLAISLVLNALEAVMPFLPGVLPVEPGTFVLFSIGTTIAAGVARIVAQPKSLGR